MQPSSKDRALAVFPAGIANGEFGLAPDDLIVVDRGEGCRLWDMEGREFLDFSMGWGSCLPGHSHPEITDAVRRQLQKGTNFAFANRNALELAETIAESCPAIERIRYCASGTEATSYCMRLARAYTGKPKILKFEGAYHGANEAGVTSLFPRLDLDFPQPEATSAGLVGVDAKLLVAPYNDLTTTATIIDHHKSELAGIVMEPLQRCTPPRPGFLDGIRSICTENGIILIYDEVVTGFRLARGGAQEYYGVAPDLAAYGKALGAGFPIGAFGGRADIMDLTNEHRIGEADYVWMASSYGGNPVSTCAALAAQRIYAQTGVYDRLRGLGEYLRSGMREALQARNEGAQIIGDGPLAQVVFSDTPVYDYRTTKSGDAAKGRACMLALFASGIFLNPMGTKLYLSLAHDQAVCDRFLDRFDQAVAQIQRDTQMNLQGP